ncbi:MAG: ATP-binding protein [Planctomycetes bacterium]|nr:ATP-binding protein [Planctomycetota bacterium]
MSNLKARIRGGESATLEFKVRSTGSEKLARVAASFANSWGGDLVVGVDDLGRLAGLDDVEGTRRDLEEAVELLNPRPITAIEHHVQDLLDAIILRVEALEFPELCRIEFTEDADLYFRIQKESRSIASDVEKMVRNLRRRCKDQRLTDEGRRLVTWLWDKGEASEPDCANRLNFSNHRLRKLAESLIGAGYLLPCRLGQGRSYAAIRPPA